MKKKQIKKLIKSEVKKHVYSALDLDPEESYSDHNIANLIHRDEARQATGVIDELVPDRPFFDGRAGA